jgi:L-alanine-DL-glutamate epimerase-like enolase superfamily enzyme
MRAVRQAAPAALSIPTRAGARLSLANTCRLLADLRRALIEQPKPAHADSALARPIPLRADESCRTLADLDRLCGIQEAINIKLDKAGGLTEALALAEEAKRQGLRIMVGGVISTSLEIAPALLVAQQADITLNAVP